MSFEQAFMPGPSNYFKHIKKPDYQEPENADEAKQLRARIAMLPGAHVLRPFVEFMEDVYLGTLDGFAYGSLMKLNSMKQRGILKPVGPLDIFTRPPTQQSDYGWFLFDPALEGATWFHDDVRHPQPISPHTKILDIGKKSNKFIRIF